MSRPPMNCDCPPMLNRPARYGSATASPVRISGVACGSGERTCRKCTWVPSIVVVNCENSFSTAACLRQSYEVRQYSVMSFT